jgi:hypothetical protein
MKRSKGPLLPDSVRSRGGILVMESLLIVASVLLGFALSGWGERRADRALAAAALRNFRLEIEANLAILERTQPTHVEIADRLGQAAAAADAPPGQTARDAFAQALPEDGLDTPPLSEAAWEAAVSTGALRLLDYDVAARLSQTYLVQRATLISTLKLLSERFNDAPNFDPGSRTLMLHVYGGLMYELAGQESYLIEQFRETLALLPEQP